MTMEPRLKTLRECVEKLDNVLRLCTSMLSSQAPLSFMPDPISRAMAEVQLIQLRAALAEGERDLAVNQEIVRRIESPVKIFRPAGFTPPTTGGAA